MRLLIVAVLSCVLAGCATNFSDSPPTTNVSVSK